MNPTIIKLSLTVIILSATLFLAGCGNKMKLNYFEKTNGVHFPAKVTVQDYHNNEEMFVRVKLIMEPTEAKKLVSQYRFLLFEPTKDSILKMDYRSILTDEIKQVFSGSGYTNIQTHNDLYYIDSCTADNRILYLLDIKKGDFWGIIEYPDWSGDKPCGDE